MEHFGVVDDSTERYFLTHDGNPVDPSEMVGTIAGKAESGESSRWPRSSSRANRMASIETELTLQADEEAVVSFLDEHGGLLLREHDNHSTYWA